MKIKIKPEIGISMFNCAAVEKWKRSVAWFPSCGAKSIMDTERNFSRKCNVSVYYRGYVKSTRVLVKKLESWQRQMGKTTVIKAGAYIMSIDRKTTVYRLEACESRFLKNMYQMSIATCSRILLTCLSLYRCYSSRAGLHNSV